MRAKCLCILLAVLLLPLGGCLGQSEINDLVFVLGVGVDKGEEENQYRMTAHLATVGVTGGSGENDGKSQGFLNITKEGIGLHPPMYEISRLINRRLHMGHNKLIVIGHQAAVEGVSPILDYFIRSSSARMTVPLLVAEGDPKAVLEQYAELEYMPVEYLNSLIATRKEASDIVDNTMISFISTMTDGTSASTLPIVKLATDDSGSPEVMLAGTAIFKGDRLTETLTLSQTRALLTLRNQMNYGYLRLEGFGGYLSLGIASSRAETQVVEENGAFSIRVTVKQQYVLADVVAETGFFSVEERQQLADLVAKQVKEELSQVVALTRSHSLDIFGYGQQIHRRYPRQAAALLDNWEEAYKELEISISVEAEIISTGALIKPLETEKPGKEDSIHE